LNTFNLAIKKVTLKKVASTRGGEWHGPCPACGGTDRFHVWPMENDGRGSYWCRGCNRAGDNIKFFMSLRLIRNRPACIGVLDLQGGVQEHLDHLEAIGIPYQRVKTA